MTERVECVVIGAGIIGLAVARKLALQGCEVVVLEAHEAIGTETSSRNSEVIHAGIYYPRDSLKARLCVAGKQALYAYCAARGLGHARIGKLIVACEENERAMLERLHETGRGNGVADLEIIGGREARRLEPNLRCVAALRSPSTGILDSHAVMLSYQGDAEDNGAVIAFRSAVQGGRIGDQGHVLDVGLADGGTMRLACRVLVNAAGLHAEAVARSLDGVPPLSIPRCTMIKGSYFSMSGRAPFSRLVYPVPQEATLGVHVTLDLAGRARFGPDNEAVEAIDYAVDPGRADAFYASVRKYFPGLADGVLQPDYAGIRVRATALDRPDADFVIQGPAAHGRPGLVNLFGIESPGLTSSLAIADHVAELVAGSGPGA